MLRVVFALLFGMAPVRVEAQPMEEAAGQLAGRISSLLPRRATVSLEFQSLSSLPAAEWSSFRSAFEAELRKTGVEIATTRPDAQVRVATSENVRGLLWVAEVITGDTRQVAMLPWKAPGPSGGKPRMRLEIQPMWQQPEPVLDLLLVDGDSGLLALSPGKVVSYRRAGDQWTATATAALLPARPLPRDPRGRLESVAGGFRVYVPGSTCIGTLAPALKLACAPGNETWRDEDLPVHWVTDRNVLEADGVRGAFFSSGAGWFASADGRVRDRAGEPIAEADGWGSDISSVKNPCGAGAAAVVASVAGNSLQAYELAGAPASEPLPLPGPVSALWPAETPERVTLVIRNSTTGNYEASRLAVACAE
jgi:hypothetical protein